MRMHACTCRPAHTVCVCTVVHVHAFACSVLFLCMCIHRHVFAFCLCHCIGSIWSTLQPCQQDVAPGLWAPCEKEKHDTFTGHSVSKWGCVFDNKLAPSSFLLQMLGLSFNCGDWVGTQQIYRQNSDACVSGRVVNSSHNTSVYTVDTEPATFAPLPCSHWIRIWHKFCTYKISKCHCSRS